VPIIELTQVSVVDGTRDTLHHLTCISKTFYLFDITQFDQYYYIIFQTITIRTHVLACVCVCIILS